MTKHMICTAAAMLLAGVAAAAPAFNEILINPPGSDDGIEFIEIKGAASEALTNITFLAIDGDGTSAGVIDLAIDLSAQSCGTNGLLLVRDSATALTPASDAATNVFVASALSGATDIENGSNTYLLVTGFTGSTGTDLDTNDDGTLDVTLPWTSVISAVALIENDGSANVAYAAALGGTNFGPNAGFNADVLFFNPTDGWIGCDILGTGTGPFTFDTTRTSDADYAGNVTPGGSNTLPTAAVGNWEVYSY